MRFCAVLCLVAATTLLGLRAASAEGVSVDTPRTFTVGDDSRPYFLHLPPDLPPDAPLVVALHGLGGSAARMRYGLGLMLGDDPVGLFGLHSRRVFGHVGFTNVFGFADPDREIAVALLTSGKPILSLHAVRLLQWLVELDRAFPRRSA